MQTSVASAIDRVTSTNDRYTMTVTVMPVADGRVIAHLASPLLLLSLQSRVKSFYCLFGFFTS